MSGKRSKKMVGPACIQPGEHTVAMLRPAWRHYLRYFFLPAAGIVIFGWQNGICLIGIFVIIVLVVCSRYSNLFIITTHRVIEQTGLVARNTAQSCLSDIQLINTNQGVVDRLLAVGHVKIESAAHNGPAGDVVFGGVLRPVEVKEMLFRLKYKKGVRRKMRRGNPSGRS